MIDVLLVSYKDYTPNYKNLFKGLDLYYIHANSHFNFIFPVDYLQLMSFFS